MKKRSRLSIIYDILSYIEREGGEVLATRLATATGLAYDRLVKILDELNDKNIVHMIVDERSRRVKITDKGLVLLKKIRDLKDLLKDLGIDIG